MYRITVERLNPLGEREAIQVTASSFVMSTRGEHGGTVMCAASETGFRDHVARIIIQVTRELGTSAVAASVTGFLAADVATGGSLTTALVVAMLDDDVVSGVKRVAAELSNVEGETVPWGGSSSEGEPN